MTDLVAEQPIMPEPSGPSADPLARTLDGLEASVERHYQAADAMYADPLSRTLDHVEAATEHRDSFWPSTANERLLAAIYDPEVGPAAPGPERREQELADTSLPLHQDQPFNAPRASASPRSELPKSWDSKQRGLAFFRPDAQPAYRVMGSGTGFRNTDAGAAWYCHLREVWVSAEDCTSCEDFQRAGDSDEDQEYLCCHSSFNRDDGQQPETESAEEE